MLDTHRAPSRALLPRSPEAPSFPGPAAGLHSSQRPACFSPPPLPAVSRRCQRQLLSPPSPSWVEAGADRSLWGQPPWGSWGWPSPEKRRWEGPAARSLAPVGPRLEQGRAWGEGEMASQSHPGLRCGPRGSGGALCWCLRGPEPGWGSLQGEHGLRVFRASGSTAQK